MDEMIPNIPDQPDSTEKTLNQVWIKLHQFGSIFSEKLDNVTNALKGYIDNRENSCYYLQDKKRREKKRSNLWAIITTILSLIIALVCGILYLLK